MSKGDCSKSKSFPLEFTPTQMCNFTQLEICSSLIKNSSITVISCGTKESLCGLHVQKLNHYNTEQ